MLTLVLGPSGSGKTNYLIQRANEDMGAGNGNIAFIDTDDSHIFSLDHQVRLINARNFKISNVDQFYGFLAGIISRDFDLEKIYVDGIYEIVNTHEKLPEMMSALEALSKENDVDILIGLDADKNELPSNAEFQLVEVTSI